MKEWQEDTWTELTTDDDQVLDVNLWTDDTTGKQYISFYPTTWNDEGYYTADGDYREGFRETDSNPIATYRVILEEKNNESRF